MNKGVTIYCNGEECSVKNTCFRFTHRNEYDGSSKDSAVIRKCTSQKKYVQDVDEINTDSKRI